MPLRHSSTPVPSSRWVQTHVTATPSTTPSEGAGAAPATPSAPRPPAPIERTFDARWVEETVAANSLRPMGVLPPFGDYVRDLWRRRSFISVLSSSQAYARNQSTFLGQAWSIITPILNAAVYVLIFGVILSVARAGIENTPAFIVVGTFIFRFFETSIMSGSKSIKNKRNLVRSVHFPRAVLPISAVLAELRVLAPSLVVMCVISWATGFMPGTGDVPVTWRWLLLVPAVGLLWIFSTGTGFVVAAWTAIAPDVENILPFVLRLLMYGSGVIFSLEAFVSQHSWGVLLEYQPVAVYLYLARSAVLQEPAFPPDPTMWLLGAGWALLSFVVGFLIFWRGEERYGRD